MNYSELPYHELIKVDGVAGVPVQVVEDHGDVLVREVVRERLHEQDDLGLVQAAATVLVHPGEQLLHVLQTLHIVILVWYLILDI